jgi:hypothetical protein
MPATTHPHGSEAEAGIEVGGGADVFVFVVVDVVAAASRGGLRPPGRRRCC